MRQSQTDNRRRFVIQEHTKGNDIHWDFMLESGDYLWTWRFNTPPEKIRSQSIRAEKIFEHPLKFLTYEGPVNNGTGNVKITEAGVCKIVNETTDRIVLSMNGRILKGKFALVRIKGGNWQFQKIIDNHQSFS